MHFDASLEHDPQNQADFEGQHSNDASRMHQNVVRLMHW